MAVSQYDTLRAQAAEVHPSQGAKVIGRMLAIVIVTAFTVLGWIAGTAWLGTVTCFFALRMGFRDGAHMARATKAKPEQDSR